MPTISIVTPVHHPSIPHLRAAYESIVRQDLPTDWRWEWLVQGDGDEGAAGAALPDDSRISYHSGAKGGPGVARTVTLGRAKGELIKNLDADDLLCAGALARDIAVLTAMPEIGWTTCRALDLLPDGEVRSWDHVAPPEGRVFRGWILDFWRSHGWLLPVVPGTLCARRDLIFRLGGWMALGASEDTGLLIALNALSDGYFIDEPGLLYRQHADQMTKQRSHFEPADRDWRRQLITERGRLLAQLFSASDRLGVGGPN